MGNAVDQNVELPMLFADVIEHGRNLIAIANVSREGIAAYLSVDLARRLWF